MKNIRISSGVQLAAFFLGTLLLAGCAEEGLSAGAIAPDFEVDSLAINGKPKTLSGLKGKVVIVDFWATWCGPCRQSFPHMQEMYEKYKDKGLEIVAISDEDESKINEFIRNNNYRFGFYRDSFRTAYNAYKVSALPTTFVVNRDGNIVGSVMGFSPNELQKMVESAL